MLMKSAQISDKQVVFLDTSETQCHIKVSNNRNRNVALICILRLFRCVLFVLLSRVRRIHAKEAKRIEWEAPGNAPGAVHNV